jgi:hypothetical protein
VPQAIAQDGPFYENLLTCGSTGLTINISSDSSFI